MSKRLLAGFLWFLTGWYAGAVLAEIFTLSAALAPILAVSVAGLIVADPRRMIWTAQPPRSGPPPASESLPDPA